MTSTLDELSNSISRIAAEARPSVVAVYGRRGAPSTGIVWNGDGIVLASAHTLESEGDIALATMDGREVTSALVGRDPGTDIAVLRSSELDKPAPEWTDSSHVEAGHQTVVLAPRRVALAIVAAVDDAWTTESGGKLDRRIEIDVNRFRGFSGSLLLDGGGGALGMNTTALARRTALTIPTETLRRVVDDLVEHGGVRRGFLGITTSPVRLPETVPSQDVGLLILSVQPGSPAADAGLFLGDVVLAVDGELADSATALLAYLGAERIGKSIDVRILRAGEETTVSVRLGERK